jgi:prepilin-type N-terminal cleavage/methylation domain-containing protein
VTERSRERGFTLVEVLATVALFCLVVAVSGPLLMRMAGLSTNVTRSQARTAASVAQATRIAALPFEDLVAAAGCTTMASPSFPHTRCITLTDTLPELRRVRIVITPFDSAHAAPDTIVVYRVNLARANPFNSL